MNKRTKELLQALIDGKELCYWCDELENWEAMSPNSVINPITKPHYDWAIRNKIIDLFALHHDHWVISREEQWDKKRNIAEIDILGVSLDWHYWDGNFHRAPIPEGFTFEIKLRNGWTRHERCLKPDEALCWKHTKTDGDVIAYRITGYEQGWELPNYYKGKSND